MKFTPTRRSLTLLLAAAGVGVASLSVAGPQHGPENCDPAHAAKFAERMEKHQTERLARLYAALKITPAQETAWKTYADASHFPKLMPSPKDDAQDTPSRLDRRIELNQKMGEHLQQEAKAAKTLYAELTPEQRKTFDDFHHPRHANQGDHQTGMPAAAGTPMQH